jgi:high-affinity iron transporter
MISAVIIVLREVLEGVLLICMLMASACAMGHRLRWLPPALIMGFAGALAYGLFLEPISMLFDGLGQEISSAVILLTTALALVVYSGMLAANATHAGSSGPASGVLLVCMTATTLSLLREGAEIYLYVYGYGVQAGQMASVLAGGTIGAGIGLSLGTFLYYGLRALSRKACLWASAAIAMMTGAAQVMQSTYNLEQADLLPSMQALWDSSVLVAESSPAGEILQAAIGYEATPTAVQLGLYAASLLLSLMAMLLGRLYAGKRRERKA